MNNNLAKQKFTPLTTTLIVLITLFSAIIVYLNFFVANFGNSDLYGELYFAKIAWEQKTIFPQGWTYSNQIYIFATPILAALFYGITGKITIAMGLATCVMSALMLISFYWCFKAFLKRDSILIGILGLMTFRITASIILDSTIGQLFFFLASYYSCHLIGLFLALGVYLRIVHNIKTPIAIYILSIVVNFVLGIQSIRQTTILIAPLIVFEFIRLIVNHFNHNIKNLTSSLRYTLILTVTNIIGYIIEKLLPVPVNSNLGSMGFSLFKSIPNKINFVGSSVMDILGFRDELVYIFKEHNYSYYVFVNLILSLILLSLFLYGIKLFFKEKDKLNSVFSVTFIFFIFSVCAIYGAMFVFDVARAAKYVFCLFVLFAITAMFIFEKTEISKKKWCIPLIIIFSVANMCTAYVPCIIKTTTQNDVQEQIANYMMDNNYTIVYGDWMHVGNVACVYADDLIAGRWTDKPLEIQVHTNVMDCYDEDDNEKAIYIFTDDDLDAVNEYVNDNNAVLTLQKEFKDSQETWYIYTSSKQLMHQSEK